MKKILITLSALALSMICGGRTFDEQSHYRSVYSTAEAKYDFDSWKTEDFNKWQSAFRAELKDRIGLADMEQQLAGYKPSASLVSTDDCGDFTRERWNFRTEPDVGLPMIVLRPKALKGRVPLVIAIQGHSKNPELFAGVYNSEKERASGEDGERNIGIQAVREGYVAIVPTTRAFGETRFEGDLKKNALSSCQEASNRDRLVGRTLIGERVWDVSRLIDWAFEELPVDRTNVILTGNSGGGTVTIYAGAIDTRVSQSLPGSAFCPYVESIGLLKHCPCNYIPGILDLGEMQDVAGLTAPRLFRAIHGIQDRIFPIEATRQGMLELEKIYAAAGASGRCSLYEGPEGHRYYKSGAWDFVRANLEPERPSNVAVAPEAPFAFEPLVMNVFPARDFPITKYGARKGNVKATTEAFSKAMDACNRAGGGRVTVPAGIWTCGGIRLKSGVDLHLCEGAVLDFIDDPSWYPESRTPIHASDCENIAISGTGRIEPGAVDGGAPQTINFNNCSNIQISDIHINGDLFQSIHLLLCKDVLIHGIKTCARGIEIEMSSHILVENCSFNQGNDGIVLESGRDGDGLQTEIPTSGIVIRSCEFRNANSLLFIGRVVSGAVRNVYMHHCHSGETVSGMYCIMPGGKSGGVVENICMEDCICNGIKNAMFSIHVDSAVAAKPATIRDIHMRNCVGGTAECLVEVLGDSREPVRGVNLYNVSLGSARKYLSRYENVYDLSPDRVRVISK